MSERSIRTPMQSNTHRLRGQFDNHFTTPDLLQVRSIPSLDGLRAPSILIVLGAHARLSRHVSDRLHWA